MDLIDITPKVFLIDAIKGTTPDYAIFDHPLIKKAGYYTGGFVEKWTWGNLDQFTEDQLKEIYFYCKNPKAKYAR